MALAISLHASVFEQKDVHLGFWHMHYIGRHHYNHHPEGQYLLTKRVTDGDRLAGRISVDAICSITPVQVPHRRATYRSRPKR